MSSQKKCTNKNPGISLGFEGLCCKIDPEVGKYMNSRSLEGGGSATSKNGILHDSYSGLPAPANANPVHVWL